MAINNQLPPAAPQQTKARYEYRNVEVGGEVVKADAKPLKTAEALKKGGVGVKDTNTIIKNDLFDGPFGRINDVLTEAEKNAVRHLVEHAGEYGLTGRGEDNLRSKLGFEVTPAPLDHVERYGMVDAEWDKTRPLDAKAIELAKFLISRPGVRGLNENDVARLKKLIVDDGTFSGPMIGMYERNTVAYLTEKMTFTKAGAEAWQRDIVSAMPFERDEAPVAQNIC